jgi:cysteine desulfurase
MIYFDNNATTKLSKHAAEKMLEMWEFAANPSSSHSFGRKARVNVEKARNKILQFLKTDKHKLIFTSSGTEANNLILSNFADKKILISSIEHPSIYEYSKYNNNVDLLSVDQNGLINLDDLQSKLYANHYDLVSVIYANNETGVIQNIQEIARISHQFGTLIHSDISQAVGKLEFSIQDLCIDFATFSAHKFYGPVGCGGLLHKSDFHIKPQILGGGQEMGIRSGTENLAAIVGAAAAIDDVIFDDHTLKLRNYMENEITNFTPNSVIFGKEVARLPNTSMITMPNVDFNIQVMQFDLEGIAISSGSACSSARITESRILSAMDIDKKIAKEAIRVSLGKENSKKEVDRFIEVWKKLSLKQI